MRAELAPSADADRELATPRQRARRARGWRRWRRPRASTPRTMMPSSVKTSSSRRPPMSDSRAARTPASKPAFVSGCSCCSCARDARDLGRRARHGRARREAAGHPEQSVVARRAGAVERERRPDLDRREAADLDLRGQDAHHLVGAGVQHQHAADDAGIRSESARPGAVAQQRRRALRRLRSSDSPKLRPSSARRPQSSKNDAVARPVVRSVGSPLPVSVALERV